MTDRAKNLDEAVTAQANLDLVARIEDVLTKDRIKTRELNILVGENREQKARIEQLETLLREAAPHIAGGLKYTGDERTAWEDWLARYRAVLGEESSDGH